MGYIISKIVVEGIRGINSKLELEMPKGLIVICGKNGTGKTSILQSIEWCLTGRFPFFQGSEFRKEDAIVNPYNPAKKATVSITLLDQDEGRKVEVTRMRKMGTSTTEKSELHVQTEKESLRQEEAQAYAEKLLGISADDFPRSVYLHQEALHGLVSEKPEERSAAVDKLLGTAELRELIEVLNPRRSIANAIDDLEESAKRFNMEKIQHVVRMRSRLAETKDRLMHKGYSENDLEASSVAAQILSIERLVAEIANALEFKLEELPIKDVDPESLATYLARIKSDLKNLDRARTSKLAVLERQKLLIESKIADFERQSTELSNHNTLDLTLLKDDRDEAKRQYEEVRSQASRVATRFSKMQSAQVRLVPLKAQIQALESLIQSYRKELGEESVVRQNYESVNARLRENKIEFENLGKLEQIIALSIRYIEEQRPESCPVCSQRISPEETVARLRQEATSAMSAISKKLEADREQLIAEQKKLQSWLDNYSRSASELSTARETMKTIFLELERSIGEPFTPETFEEKFRETSEQLRELKALEATKLSEVDERRAEYEKVEILLHQLQDNLANLKKLLETQSNDRNELLKLSKLKIEALENEAMKYHETKQLDSVEQDVSKLEEVVQFLKDKAEVEALDSELPSVENRVEELKMKIASLQKLDGSLAAIRGVAAQVQKELVNKEMKSLETILMKHFDSLLSHPAFPNLNLSIEKEEPLQYSIKASGSAGSTYIPTRFSTAQLNSVGIAIFLANNEKLVESLRTIIFDDPSQSMDSEHKHRLAQCLKSLAKDHQVIVATQDEELSSELAKLEMSKVFELGPWTVERIAIAN
jgi:exonuclease SbcC